MDSVFQAINSAFQIDALTLQLLDETLADMAPVGLMPMPGSAPFAGERDDQPN